MRKFFYLGLIALAGIIIGFAWAEQVTLTTYYPAPYGVYKTMKADILHIERTQQTEHNSVDKEEGMIICDDGDNTIKRWDSTVSDWVLLCPPGVEEGLQLVGRTDISSPATEALMAGMRTNVTTSARFLVKFSAPMARDPAFSGARSAMIRIYIDGTEQTSTFVIIDEDAGTMVQQVNLHYLGWPSGGGSHTIEVTWQGSGIVQPGATCAERVLTIVPFG